MIHASFTKDGTLEGFHDDAIRAAPKGAMKIGDGQHAEWLEALSRGQTIRMENGSPVVSDLRDPIAVAREGAVNNVNRAIAVFTGKFSDGLPRESVAAWPSKAAAARAHTAADPSPMIVAEAEMMGISPEEHATRVVAKADRYEILIAKLDGLRSVTLGRIAKATSVEEIDGHVATTTATLADLAPTEE